MSVTTAQRTNANVLSDQDQPFLSAGPGKFPPRLLATRWPATCQPEQELLARLMSPPFVLERSAKQARRVGGLKLMVAWLADQAGQTWQERWLSSGADGARGGRVATGPGRVAAHV